MSEYDNFLRETCTLSKDLDQDVAGSLSSWSHPRDAELRADDICRDVYGLLGLPIDAIDFSSLIETMDAAVARRKPFLISTPNVNFLLKSHENPAFRDAVLSSDLCLADGMPLIWIAKLLRVPIQERVAGSDLFGRLKARKETRLRVFLFGGIGDLAAKVGAKLNAERCGLECVGVLNPGFGTLEDLSSSEIIDTINASGADLLAVFLSAEKAQAWLLRNHSRLTVPVRAQFGATINFEAGTIKRAPPFLRSTGFEWLWRIKEEPYLWRRYLSDGIGLVRLLLSSALPLASLSREVRAKNRLIVERLEDDDRVTIRLSGSATGSEVDRLIQVANDALDESKPITLDLFDMDYADGRFFGLLLVLGKQLSKDGLSLSIVRVRPRLRRIFRLNKFEFLLADA